MKTSVKIVLYTMMIATSIYLPNILRAQNTENKDVVTIITIHVKMKTIGINSLYTDRQDTLRKTLESIDGAKNIKIELTKQLVRFEIPSNKIISEHKLRKIIAKVGFYPTTIEFLKEIEDEEEKDDVPSIL